MYFRPRFWLLYLRTLSGSISSSPAGVVRAEIRTYGWPMEPRERVKLKPPRLTYYEARWENESSVVGRITGILESQGLGGAIAYLVYTAGISPAEAARMLGIYEDQAVELMARALNQVRIKKHGTRKTLQHG